jgi:hypothetical protein
MATALGEVEDLICRRADELTHQAIHDREPWLTHLGPQPTQPAARAEWIHAVTIIAAYRERHDITSNDPLGPKPAKLDHTHTRDRHRAARVLQGAQALGPHSKASEPQPALTTQPTFEPPSIA